MTNNCKKVLLQKRADAGKTGKREFSIWRWLTGRSDAPRADKHDARSPEGFNKPQYPTREDILRYLQRREDARARRGGDPLDVEFRRSQNLLGGTLPSDFKLRHELRKNYFRTLDDVAKTAVDAKLSPETAAIYTPRLKHLTQEAAEYREDLHNNKSSAISRGTEEFRAKGRRWITD